MYKLLYLFILLRIGQCEMDQNLDQNEPKWILFGSKDRDHFCSTWKRVNEVGN